MPEQSGSTVQSTGSAGPIVVIVIAAIVVVGIIAYLLCRRRSAQQKAAPPISVIEPQSEEQRRRPDLRVGYADPSRQHTEVETTAGVEPQGESPLLVGAAQTIGEREDQEDAYGYTEWKLADVVSRKGFMAVMADGIGGLQDGQVASQAAVRGAMEMFDMQSADEAAADRVLEITAAAQRHVLVEGSKVGTENGCTFLCVLIHDLELSMASVGDSKIALFRGGVLLQLNREHVLGREIDETNILAGDRRVENAKRRKAITAYLGKHELRTIDRTLRPMQLVSGDRVLLMSDGIFNTLGDNALAAYQDMEPQAAASAIVQAVNERKIQGQDNATIVIVGVK